MKSVSRIRPPSAVKDVSRTLVMRLVAALYPGGLQRRDPPVAASGVVEEPTEERGGVETAGTVPVDGPVTTDERRGVAVTNRGVVGNR